MHMLQYDVTTYDSLREIPDICPKCPIVHVKHTCLHSSVVISRSKNSKPIDPGEFILVICLQYPVYSVAF